MNKSETEDEFVIVLEKLIYKLRTEILISKDMAENIFILYQGKISGLEIALWEYKQLNERL